MKIEVLSESGYLEALLGLSLSFYDHKQDIDEWWDVKKQVKAAKRAVILAGKGGGHDKFLRSINIQLYIQATRSFWSEFDTYGIGVTKNSSSTMHTLDKRPVIPQDFSEGTSEHLIESFNDCLEEYKNKNSIYYKDITRLKDNLPEGWLQERQVSLNYASLANIISQRHNHRLKYWKEFCTTIAGIVDHPEFLPEL